MAMLKSYSSSDDSNIHLNICLSDKVNTDISDISYGYGYILDKFVIEGAFEKDIYLNNQLQNTVEAATKTLTDASNCIDITNQLGITYPLFLNSITPQHSGTKIKDKKISAYACPVAKSMLGDTLVISNSPCGTASYSFSVYTANDIGNAGTESNITLQFCGNDILGKYRCFESPLNKMTSPGQTSHLLVEKGFVLVDSLSLTKKTTSQLILK